MAALARASIRCESSASDAVSTGVGATLRKAAQWPNVASLCPSTQAHRASHGRRVARNGLCIIRDSHPRRRLEIAPGHSSSSAIADAHAVRRAVVSAARAHRRRVRQPVRRRIAIGMAQSAVGDAALASAGHGIPVQADARRRARPRRPGVPARSGACAPIAGATVGSASIRRATIDAAFRSPRFYAFAPRRRPCGRAARGTAGRGSPAAPRSRRAGGGEQGRRAAGENRPDRGKARRGARVRAARPTKAGSAGGAACRSPRSSRGDAPATEPPRRANARNGARAARRDADGRRACRATRRRAPSATSRRRASRPWSRRRSRHRRCARRRRESSRARARTDASARARIDPAAGQPAGAATLRDAPQIKFERETPHRRPSCHRHPCPGATRAAPAPAGQQRKPAAARGACRHRRGARRAGRADADPCDAKAFVRPRARRDRPSDRRRAGARSAASSAPARLEFGARPAVDDDLRQLVEPPSAKLPPVGERPRLSFEKPGARDGNLPGGRSIGPRPAQSFSTRARSESKLARDIQKAAQAGLPRRLRRARPARRSRADRRRDHGQRLSLVARAHQGDSRCGTIAAAACRTARSIDARR